MSVRNFDSNHLLWPLALVLGRVRGPETLADNMSAEATASRGAQNERPI